MSSDGSSTYVSRKCTMLQSGMTVEINRGAFAGGKAEINVRQLQTVNAEAHMTRFRRLVFVVACAVSLLSPRRVPAQELLPYFEHDSIRVDHVINEQRSVFLFDTGASHFALFETAATRLRLKSEAMGTQKVNNVEITVKQTVDEVDLTVFGHDFRTKIRVLPFRHEYDGMFTWNDLPGAMWIDGFDRKIFALDGFPSRETWQVWKLEEDNALLFFQLTKNGEPLGRVFVDTGVAGGLRLTPSLWKTWKQNNPDEPTTFETLRYPLGPVVAGEIAWVDEFKLGDLTLRRLDVGVIPDAKDGIAVDENGNEYIATIGMCAIRHLRMIISKKTGELWTKTVSKVPAHNRLGAVFVPRSEKDTELRCQLISGSPASEAGLMAGDVLLRIDDEDFVADKELAQHRIRDLVSRSAGTELEIHVERDGETHKFRITLRDLLQ